MQFDKPERTVRVFMYLKWGVHHESTSFASTQTNVVSSILLFFSSVSFPTSPHLPKCAFSKELNALEMPSPPPPNPANLHSTLNPASGFQHLWPYFHTNMRISYCYCCTKILTNKIMKVNFPVGKSSPFYFKMLHVSPLSLQEIIIIKKSSSSTPQSNCSL